MTVSKFRKCRFGGLVESARMPSIDAASFARLQADKKLAPVFKLKRVRYVMEAAEVLTRTSDLWLSELAAALNVRSHFISSESWCRATA